MTFRILETPGVPRGLESYHAAEAARQVEARAAAEAAHYEEQRRIEARTKEGVAALLRGSEERKKLEVAAKQKRDAEALERFERQRFFDNAPAATEADWQRNRQTVLDEALRAGRGPVQAAKERLRASGRYSAF